MSSIAPSCDELESEEASEDAYSEFYMTDDDGAFGVEATTGALHTESRIQVGRAYDLVTVEELRSRYENMVAQVSDTLGLTRDVAVVALRCHDWDPFRLNERWFDDPDTTKAEIGVCTSTERGTTRGEQDVWCPICFDRYDRGSMLSAGCGHYVCTNCYRGYLAANIDEKQKVSRLKCPLYKCNALVPRAVIARVATEAQMSKLHAYDDALLVETNSRASWPLDIVCSCGTTYCFTCKNEAHRPVDCETVNKWLTKSSAEGENLSWIIVNTKACPKCSRPIEKNHGCMHMTCSLCSHEFCWLCMEPWSQHGDSTGGYYACNRYEMARRQGKYTAEEMRRKNASASLSRYTHYCERYLAHDTARKVAVKAQEHMLTSALGLISLYTKTPESQLRFIVDAHKAVIECRRILKWTYAYGYYTFDTSTFYPGEEASEAAKKAYDDKCAHMNARKDFFEFLQGDAESSLEPLTRMLEKDLSELIEEKEREAETAADAGGSLTGSVSHPAHEVKDNVFAAKFSDLQQRLITSTKMTENYFEKLVQMLQIGLDNISEQYAGGPSHSGLETDAGPSS